mmetsp:Transcript_7774/g.21647  ORF Transcript_7774/g.21647 Transcript_7774/m.21647 type:complete len:470 (+) Transcript_7774:1357-2766(+)
MERRPDSASPLLHDLDNFILLGNGFQIFVARHNFIDKSKFLGLYSDPVFARRNFLDIVLQLRPGESDMILEGPVHIIKFLLKLLLVLLRHFTNYVHRSLVLASSEEISINVMLIEESLKVWYLRDDSNTANDGERCSADCVADACHHIASRCGDSIHANDKLNARLSNTYELRCRQAIGTHSPTGRRNNNDGPIDTRSATIHDDRNLLPQQLHAREHHIPIESNKERDRPIVTPHVPDGKTRLQILLNPLFQLLALLLIFILACLIFLLLCLSHFLHITDHIEMNPVQGIFCPLIPIIQSLELNFDVAILILVVHRRTSQSTAKGTAPTTGRIGAGSHTTKAARAEAQKEGGYRQNQHNDARERQPLVGHRPLRSLGTVVLFVGQHYPTRNDEGGRNAAAARTGTADEGSQGLGGPTTCTTSEDVIVGETVAASTSAQAILFGWDINVGLGAFVGRPAASAEGIVGRAL